MFQQVPRAVIVSELGLESVTPNVAVVFATEDAVGVANIPDMLCVVNEPCGEYEVPAELVAYPW